jgi:hypothetical protein
MDPEVATAIGLTGLIVDVLANAISAMALNITVMSAYLLVAYLVGKDLTRSQTLIATGLYVAFSGSGVLGIFSYYYEAFRLSQTYGNGSFPVWWAYLIGGLYFAGILGCLKFMWDIRHSKTE